MINGYKQYLNKAALTPGLVRNFFETSIGLGKFIRQIDYQKKCVRKFSKGIIVVLNIHLRFPPHS